MKMRKFLGQIILFFCCIVSLVWAGCGLVSLPVGWKVCVDESLVSAWSMQICVSKSSCTQCVKGSHTGFKKGISRKFNGVVYVEWKVQGLKLGKSGCENKNYSICGGWVCWDCQNDKSCNCGKVVVAKDRWGDAVGAQGGNGGFPAGVPPTYNHDCVKKPNEDCDNVSCCK